MGVKKELSSTLTIMESVMRLYIFSVVIISKPGAAQEKE
jgi:hypothetical protein